MTELTALLATAKERCKNVTQSVSTSMTTQLSTVHFAKAVAIMTETIVPTVAAKEPCKNASLTINYELQKGLIHASTKKYTYSPNKALGASEPGALFC